MAVGIVDRQKLVNIADAVRAKKGITGNMTLDAIASNITSMPTADNNAKFDFAGSGSKSEGSLIKYLTTVDLSNLDTSSYTNMNSMFQDCISLTSLDVSGFDTSNADTMSSMFQDCISLTSLDVSGFDTSNVANMEKMFSGCRSLTSLDVLSFNTSKVQNYGSFAGMFSGCISLETLDLSNFDFSNTYASAYTGMYALFSGCRSLKTIKLPATVTFNKSGICMGSMFYSCSSLTTLDLSGFDTSKVTDIGGMFQYCYKLSNLTLGTDWASNSNIDSFDLSYCPLTHESAVDVINKLATRSNSPVIKFSNAVGLYQSEIDIATNKGWSVSGCIVLVEDPTTATVGQGAIIDGVVSKCVYVADTVQSWGQRIFGSSSEFTDSNGNSNFQWGGYGTATGITARDIGTGLANTNALLAMNLQSTDGTPTVWDAIKEFRSKYGDRWFIQSESEGQRYNYRGKNYNDYIWTSSESDANYAYRNKEKEYTTDSKYKTYLIIPFTYV